MVFGGVNESRQISTIDQCSLTRVGKLEFSFNYGACTTAHDQIYLCFGISAVKQCYTASGLVSHEKAFLSLCLGPRFSEQILENGQRSLKTILMYRNLKKILISKTLNVFENYRHIG